MSAAITSYSANFEELAATVASAASSPMELRAYIDGLRAIDASDEGFYGPYTSAATIVLNQRVQALEAKYTELRAMWQGNLDKLISACEIDPKDIHPGNGPGMLSALKSLEEVKNDFKDDAFGDLLPEAVRVTEEAVARFKQTLSTIALMVLDPDTVNPAEDVPIDALEFALRHSKQMPVSADAFFGDEAKLAEAKRRFPLWIKRQEEIIEQRREKDRKKAEGLVQGAAEVRDEMAHRNRVHDASLTADQRGARQARMHEAAPYMFDLIRRITEIAHMDDAECVGVIDGDGLVEVAHRSEAMVARIEGRTN